MRFELIDDFLNSNYITAIIEMARPRLTESLVWDPATGLQKKDPYRVSEQMFFQPGENALIAEIERGIADVTELPLQNGEGIQVLHYGPGGYYKPHYDYFDPEFEGNRAALVRGGQRKATFMCYLVEPDEGGGTSFPEIGFTAKPIRGRAIFWRNLKPDGSLDPTTLHAAEPVVRGEKWAMQKWFREREFV